MAEPVEVGPISEYGLMAPALLGAPAETAAPSWVQAHFLLGNLGGPLVFPNLFHTRRYSKSSWPCAFSRRLNLHRECGLSEHARSMCQSTARSNCQQKQAARCDRNRVHCNCHHCAQALT